MDFFDIGNDSLLLSGPQTQSFSATQQLEFEEVLQRLDRRDQDGDFSPMTLWPSRAGVKANLVHSKKCYAPLYKAVIDPFGHLWSCCLGAQPYMQADKFRLGTVRSADDLRGIVESWQKDGSAVPLDLQCSECPEHEFVTNRCIEAVVDAMERDRD